MTQADKYSVQKFGVCNIFHVFETSIMINKASFIGFNNAIKTILNKCFLF